MINKLIPFVMCFEKNSASCLLGILHARVSDAALTTPTALNLLTPSVVRSAASLIRTGKRIQLDRELAHGQQLGFAYRKQFEQKVIDHGVKTKTAAFDDELNFNTQGSSQWDGLKHVSTASSG